MNRTNKPNPLKNSKKISNIFQPNIKVYQSPNPSKQNIIYNNNNNSNFKNNNIRTNKMQYHPKEKIIEGELNFSNNKNNKKSSYNKISNNTKQKKVRNKPTKSPIPIPRNYNYSNYQRLFINHKPNNNNNNILKPKSAFQRKNNFMVNSNNNINENNNLKKSNNINPGSSSNFTSNKTYNAFNIFRKNLERKQSPFQKASINNYNLIQKSQIKSRYVSKSPILSKGSKFNKYKINIFGNINNNTNTNSITNNISSTANNTNNNKNTKKKAQVKNNINNNIKQMTYSKQNNVMNNNIIRAKGRPTLIQGEFNQDSNGVKFNINKKNIDINSIVKNINYNDDVRNIKPVFNSQNLKPEHNNIKLNNKTNKPEINNNINKEKETDKKKNTQNENKKRKPRSQSTGLVNPFQKEPSKPEKETPIKQLIQKESKYITKKIKDILPYSHVGFDGEEPKENNQDNYFIYKNFMNKNDYIYMSVCDGHGVEGHFVSEFMKEILPYDMSENLKFCDLMSKDEKEKEKINTIIKDTFIVANDKLVENQEINSLFSGSTCVSVIYTPKKLIVPNIGDSRAVLGRLINKETNEYKAIELSRDHKPTEKDEAQRIIENEGRIQPFFEEGEFVGPQRVWIKEEEVPGLAMTRSFGDRVAATVGVISEPEIKEFLFDEGDKFMIVASDGIWEFISSQECVDIIKEFYDKNDLKGCCEFLYQESSKRWLKEEEVIDDTTLILVFFE